MTNNLSKKTTAAASHSDDDDESAGRSGQDHTPHPERTHAHRHPVVLSLQAGALPELGQVRDTNSKRRIIILNVMNQSINQSSIAQSLKHLEDLCRMYSIAYGVIDGHK